MPDNSQTRTNGTGFVGALTIAFVVLKLTKQIDWPWGLVLAPLWVPAAVILAILILGACIAAVKNLFKRRETGASRPI